MQEHQIIHHPYPGYIVLADHDEEECLWHRLIATTWHDGFNIAISDIAAVDTGMLVASTPLTTSKAINLTRAQAEALRGVLDEFLNERTA